MLKSIITLIVTLIVGVVFMAIGNDFLNGSTDLGVIVAVAVAGALVVFLMDRKENERYDYKIGFLMWRADYGEYI